MDNRKTRFIAGLAVFITLFFGYFTKSNAQDLQAANVNISVISNQLLLPTTPLSIIPIQILSGETTTVTEGKEEKPKEEKPIRIMFIIRISEKD